MHKNKYNLFCILQRILRQKGCRFANSHVVIVIVIFSVFDGIQMNKYMPTTVCCKHGNHRRKNIILEKTNPRRMYLFNDCNFPSYFYLKNQKVEEATMQFYSFLSLFVRLLHRRHCVIEVF